MPTGITAIRAHGGNQYLDRVPAAVVVGNGFGKLLGSTQVNELGELESPILLTCTLCVWRAADALCFHGALLFRVTTDACHPLANRSALARLPGQRRADARARRRGAGAGARSRACWR